MKSSKGYSLSLINILFLFIFLSIIVIPLTIWSYVNFENTLKRNYKDYFKQTKNIAQIIIEEEGTLLQNSLKEIVNILEIGGIRSRSDNLESINIDNTLFDEMDLAFLIKGEKFLDLSSSLYDTENYIKEIIKKRVNKSLTLVKLDVLGEETLILLSQKRVINRYTGKVIASLYVGSILNNRLTLINKIKEKAHLESISLYSDEELIISSNKIEHKEFLGLLSKKGSIYEYGNFIYNEEKLKFFGEDFNLNIIVSIKNDVFHKVKNDFKNQMIFLTFIVFIIMIISYFIIKSLIIKPLDKLLVYANMIKNEDSVGEFTSPILEFNNLSKGLKDIIVDLRDMKEQYKIAVDGTQDGLWDWSISKRKIFYSKRFEEILGYSEGELNSSKQSSWEDIIHIDFQKKAFKKLEEHFKKQSSSFEMEYKAKCKDGSYKWVKSRGKALFDNNGEAFRMVGFNTDIDSMKVLESENRRQEHILIQQSKITAMGEMISNIAHQWRQPLNFISSIATGTKVKIEFGLFDEKEVVQDLDKLNGSVQFLSKTIDNFRNFYQDSGIRGEFSASEIIDELLSILSSCLESEKIEVILELEQIEIDSYKSELIQVLTILITNAKDVLIKHKDFERVIFIKSYKSSGERVVFEILDNGGGVESEIKDKIFEPYFTTKHQSQGTGLGLYMAKEIVNRQLNGTIEFSDEVVTYRDKSYKGASFRLVL